jgi:hypothetical protein
MEATMDRDRTKNPSASRSGRAGVATVVLLALAAVACGESSAQGVKSAADHAAFMERTRCAADDDDKALGAVLGGSAVQRVQPLYSTVDNAKAGLQAELRGATVVVEALPGITAEWLDRALECHSAKEALGHTTAASDDPFWLPGSSVDIDVRSARDGFDVAVSAYSSSDAHQVLARANAFAKSKASTAPKEAEAAH